jgi:hypothetical protein
LAVAGYLCVAATCMLADGFPDFGLRPRGALQYQPSLKTAARLRRKHGGRGGKQSAPQDEQFTAKTRTRTTPRMPFGIISKEAPYLDNLDKSFFTKSCLLSSTVARDLSRLRAAGVASFRIALPLWLKEHCARGTCLASVELQ